MEQYCHSIEEIFMEEMFPRPDQPYLQPQKQSAWLEKAKLSIQGDKKIEPFNFKPQVGSFKRVYLLLTHFSPA